MKILITGGIGFIDSHTVILIEYPGYERFTGTPTEENVKLTIEAMNIHLHDYDKQSMMMLKLSTYQTIYFYKYKLNLFIFYSSEFYK